MERITKEIIQELINTNKVELFSTQPRLCLPIINRIYKKMSNGIKFSGIKVEGNLICDGHHRYLASLLAKFSLERISGTSTSATTIINWELVTFEEADWDTLSKINMLNKQDAAYNNISIERIIELLK